MYVSVQAVCVVHVSIYEDTFVMHVRAWDQHTINTHCSTLTHQSQQTHCLPGPARHLQHSMPFRVKSALQFGHVAVLLWVDVLVREVHAKALNVDQHIN